MKKRKGYVATSAPTAIGRNYRTMPLDGKHVDLKAIAKKYGYRPLKGLPLPVQRKK